MIANPEACILKTDGINCEEEMQHAFTVAGANIEQVHINELRSGARNLADYHILGLPGGFSYGDDIVSGKILAHELSSFLKDDLQEFVDAGKPIIGICNGFQTQVRLGLLPDSTIGNQTASLTYSNAGHFACKWIDLEPQKSVCEFVQPEDFTEALVPMQMANGEGRFTAPADVIEELIANRQIVFKYLENPNGSAESIAALCDPSGLIVGIMPHPERSIAAFHPDRSRTQVAKQAGEVIFGNIVKYARES